MELLKDDIQITPVYSNSASTSNLHATEIPANMLQRLEQLFEMNAQMLARILEATVVGGSDRSSPVHSAGAVAACDKQSTGLRPINIDGSRSYQQQQQQQHHHPQQQHHQQHQHHQQQLQGAATLPHHVSANAPHSLLESSTKLGQGQGQGGLSTGTFSSASNASPVNGPTALQGQGQGPNAVKRPTSAGSSRRPSTSTSTSAQPLSNSNTNTGMFDPHAHTHNTGQMSMENSS